MKPFAGSILYKMNLQQLKYFVALADVGHFGRASERLCITQPALSNSIKGLERELGSDLFERTSKRCFLTPYGLRFYEHVVKALAELERAVNLPAPVCFDENPIKIATVASTQHTFLPSLLVEYAQATRHTTAFEIFDAHTSTDCAALLEEGGCDLAFCAKPTSSGSGVWFPVLAQELVIAVSIEHPLAMHSSVSLSELLDYPLVSYRRPSAMFFPVKSLTDSLGVRFREAFNDEVGASPYVAANTQCVALLLNTVEGSIRSKIRYIPIRELDNAFHMVGLYYIKSSLANERTALFVEYIEKTFSDLQEVIPVEDFLTVRDA